MSASRWERLLDTRPVPLVEHLLDEVAQLVGKDLEQWPLPVTELDPVVGARFAPLLAPDSRRPDARVFTEAFRLARWELLREVEAVDDYMRNRRWLEHGLSDEDRSALLFISRWLVEQLLGLGEATVGRVTRKRMLECLDRVEARRRAP